MNNRPRVGVGTLIFSPDHKLLLGKRIASHGANTWGIPAGHLEYGESFEECSIRETLEETGLVIQNPEFYGISNDIFEDTQKHYISIVMKAYMPESCHVTTKEPDKIIDWTWFDFDNLPQPLFYSLQRFVYQEGSVYWRFPLTSSEPQQHLDPQPKEANAPVIRLALHE